MSLLPWTLENPFFIGRVLRAAPDKAKIGEEALQFCFSKYEHLVLIWGRLEVEAAEIDRLTKIRWEQIQKAGLGARTLEGEELTTFRQHMRLVELYELDHEDLIIHSKLMLDDIAFLAARLIGDGQLPMRALWDQRDWFLDETHIPYPKDEVYARYIREETRWIEPLVHWYRNEFVEHNIRYPPFGVLQNPGGPPRPVRRPPTGPSPELAEDAKEVSLIINDLRSKHAELLKDAPSAASNDLELLDLLEAHLDGLTEDEIGSLDKVRSRIGAKLPNPNEICRHTQDLVGFVGSHFLA